MPSPPLRKSSNSDSRRPSLSTITEVSDTPRSADSPVRSSNAHLQKSHLLVSTGISSCSEQIGQTRSVACQYADFQLIILVLDDIAIDASSSTSFTTAQGFYQNNSNTFNSSANAVAASLDFPAVENQIRGFAESSRVLMKILDEVQTIHPFIGGMSATYLFVYVNTDSSGGSGFQGCRHLGTEAQRQRSENHRAASQDARHDVNPGSVRRFLLAKSTLPIITSRLRGIKPDQTDSDGKSVEGRLKAVMNDIANDIEACGNVCDVYSKKRLIGWRCLVQRKR